MNNLLNRIAWIVSISLGYALASLLSDWYTQYIGFTYMQGPHWISTIILSLLVKRILLPKKLIDTELEQYKTSREKLASKHTADKPMVFEKPVSEIKTNFKESPIPAKISPEKQVPEKSIVPKPESERPIKPQSIFYDEPKEPNFIQKFFSENLMAKIGGILLFLGVLFLLQLVYTAIGPVGKLITGFAIGFAVYGTGMFVDKKGLVKQSRILIGTGILINYLVILSGRFLIGEGTFTDKMFLNEGVTFLLLIMNTMFAVVTSLLYRSHALLFFSFVFAFLNPFLIGAEASSTPYTLIGYSFIIAVGVVFLSYFFRNEKDLYSSNLLTTAFLGGNILFLAAPFSSTPGWLLKLVMTGIMTILTVGTAYKTGQTKKLGWYFLGGYLFLTALLGYAGFSSYSGLGSTASLLTICFFMLSLLLTALYIFSMSSILFVLGTMAAPLIIITGLLFYEVIYVSGMIYIILGSLVVYLAIFARISNGLSPKIQYLFFGCLGLFTGFISLNLNPECRSLMGYTTHTDIQPLTATLAVIISAFIFQLSTYFFSAKKSLQYFYSMGTGMGIWLLLSIIDRNEYLVLSLVSIIGFMALNLVLPFINPVLLKSKIRNLVFGLIGGVLFMAGNIYYFGEKYFAGLGIGVSYFIQAVLYFFLGYFLYQKQKKISMESARDVIYAMLGISISLFSLAVAFIFSRHSEVVSAVWIFEACVVLFFYQRNKDIKIYIAGCLLIIIGLWKLTNLILHVSSGEYLTLIPISIILTAFVIMLKFLETETHSRRWFHDGAHLLGISLIGILLMLIIPSHGHGMSILGIGIGCVIMSAVYTLIYSHKLTYIFSGALILFFAYQTSMQPEIKSRLIGDEVEHLIFIQYITTLLMGLSVYLFNKFYRPSSYNNEKYAKMLCPVLNLSFILYLFVITSVYVYDFFNSNEFSLTIYWGILTSAVLSYGIQKNQTRWRTIGLYILVLTVLKILCYDVWQQLDNAVLRIFALMLIGGLMIAISIIYEKKLEGNLKQDFLLKNII